MNKRREFLKTIALGGAALSLPVTWPQVAAAQARLPMREIAQSGESLPIVGLGNSNAFRSGDLPASTELISLFHARGGAYIDCSGSSRFVVAEVGKALGIGTNLFLGTYFTGEDEEALKHEREQLLALTGKEQLDLMHSYPEFAVPNWSLFERWKAEGFTRFIGLARHQARFYKTMMDLMETDTVDFIQVNYSPLETEAEEAILPLALEMGVAVTINRPFINGEYFSRVRGQEVPEWAKEFDCDNWAAFSLKFILSHPAVTCVLTETANPAHAIQNIEAGIGPLPDEKNRKRIVAYLQNL